MLGLSNPEMGVLMLGMFVVFIMFGFPIAFTLMALGVFFGYFAMGDLVFQLLVQRSYSVMTNDVLISIPLFVFMGYIIERANILDRLFRSLQLAAGPIPASLALATLATCAIFATATGIVGAVVTLMGLLAFPAMLRAGYDVKISAGVVCAGGCLGILIPPSVMLILYGATAGVSVVKLYAGAFFPGMIAFVYAGYGFSELSRRMNEHSSASPNGPIVWPFKWLIVVVGVLMVIQGIVEVFRCLICIRTGTWPKRLHDVEELEKVILEKAEQAKLAEAAAAEEVGLRKGNI